MLHINTKISYERLKNSESKYDSSNVAWNPIKVIRKRFDDELIEMLEKLKRRDKSIDEINNLIPILTSSDLESVENKIKKLLK